MTRAERWSIAAAALVAVAVPAALLGYGLEPAPLLPPVQPLLAPAAPPANAAAFGRDLFGTGDAAAAADAPPPGDAPQLAGIVGRIGSDAVAMVRTADGRTRTIAVGEGVDGWTLESLAIDAAFFTRAGQRARVPLPAGDGG